MEYQVLSRKYRPQNFKEIVGQSHIVNTLVNSINLNRIAHGYLFSGLRGVGKTTAARVFAKTLNCLNKKDNITCEKCQNCIEIKESRNLDVIELDGASNRGIDEIREIKETVKYPPISSLYKIFIIDEVHMLTKEAFNALLKTLEEPPVHVKFLFATTEVKKIPFTIISRCQRFDLHRIESKALSSHLLSIAEKEKVKIDKQAIALIVSAAEGSVRDSLSLLDQAIVNSDKETISSNTIIDMLGLTDRVKVFDLMESILEGKVNETLVVFRELYDSGADIVIVFSELLKITHFLTQLKIDKDLKNDIYIPEFERKKGIEMAEKISISSLGIIWQVLYKGFQEIQQGSNLFQHAEMLLIRLIFLYDGPSPNDLVKKIEQEIKKNEFNQKVEKKNTESNNITTINKVQNSNSDSQNLKKNISIKTYREFVDFFYKKKEGIIHAFLYNDVQLISFQEGQLVINSQKIKDSNFQRTVAKLISKWTGRIWKITNSDSNLGKTLHEEDLLNQQKEIELMKNDSEIQNLLERFPGSEIHSITPIYETTDEKISDNDNNNVKEK